MSTKPSSIRARSVTSNDLDMLEALEQKTLWLASWMIHNANHLRDNQDGLKVGGHQASCASAATLMTALYCNILRPEDRVAVKPHASPVFHALQYLYGRQSRGQLENFRGWGGAQSYPSRTKDKDDVDYSTGSVGLGAAMTAFASLAQDYIQAHEFGDCKGGRHIAIVGDGELDEGNIFEALMEGWKHGLRNCWWIIDYNRQSLDGVVSDNLFGRIDEIFSAMGWHVITLKYGYKLQAITEQAGGPAIVGWIDDCPNALYSALTFQGGAAWRQRLNVDLASDPDALALIEAHDDAALAALMTNLGGHDMGAILDVLNAIDHDRPVALIAYTIKGFGLPLQGHKDNHAGLMNESQFAEFQERMQVPKGAEWDLFAGLPYAPDEMRAYLAGTPFGEDTQRRHLAGRIETPKSLPLEIKGPASTQEGFGRILNDIARSQDPATRALSERIITTSPDVTVSTNLGGWVNQRGVFSLKEIEDTFRDEKIPSMQRWRQSPAGQHLELGIAENNFFLMLAALGLTHSLFGERLIPIGTLYDPFIARGLDALNYACYQDARFILVGTPSGISLAPEGGAHQSIGTPLIGMAQDGLASFEPAFVDELAAILAWSFDYVQRHDDEGAPHDWLRDDTGGSVYLRLSTRKLEQISRRPDLDLAKAAVMGGYWLRPPGPACEVVIAYQGAVAGEAIQAAGLIGEDRRDVGVLAITSADRLNAGWHAARRARRRGQRHARGYVEELLEPLPRHAGLVTVLDGHPTALSWLGGVRGLPVIPLGVEHFGQSGQIHELYRHHEINTSAIVDAAQDVIRSRPVRFAAN